MKALAASSIQSLNRVTPMTWCAIFLVVTCVLALGLPPDPKALAQLHTTAQGYRIAILVLLVPYIVCWYAGFYVFAKLSEYTPYLKKSVEGSAFAKTTRGMGLLAFGLVVPTLISLLLGQVAQRHPDSAASIKIINNYIGLLFPLAAMLYISAGARMLAGATNVRPKFGGIQIFVGVFITLSTFYTFLVTYNYYHFHNPYHLHILVLLLTFIVPYLYLWYLGLLSAYDLKHYSINVKGVLYKKALNLFASGLAITICGSIIEQFLSGSVGARQSSIGWILLLDYIILAFIGAGLAMMAVGASKLKKIEEV